MNDKMPEQLLGDPNQKPTHRLFKRILGEQVHDIMKKIDQTILDAGLVLEWRYYYDGKAWLGKVTFKKKTVVWLSVWKEFIKAGFYFTEKTRQGVIDLDFDDSIKSSFAVTKPVGKLIPLVVDIKDEEGLKDFSQVLVYKKNLCQK